MSWDTFGKIMSLKMQLQSSLMLRAAWSPKWEVGAKKGCQEQEQDDDVRDALSTNGAGVFKQNTYVRACAKRFIYVSF